MKARHYIAAAALVPLLILLRFVTDINEGRPGMFTVTDVIDGDTVELNRREKLRLLDIDTPEQGEPYSDKAREFLARLVLGEVPFRPHRAVTMVLIRNQAEDSLYLERLKLPVNHFSLFAAENGYFWTEQATLIRKKADELSELKLGKTPPREAGKVNLITKARLQEGVLLKMRAFGKFLR